MNDETFTTSTVSASPQSVISNLIEKLKETAHPHCVSITLFVSGHECGISYDLRDPTTLLRDGVSMKNIRGEWIK